MNNIREYFLDKIKEKHIVDKILKEYREDDGDGEICELLRSYYLSKINYKEYKIEERKIIEIYYIKNQSIQKY